MPEILALPDAARYVWCRLQVSRRDDSGMETLQVVILAVVLAAAAAAVGRALSDQSTRTVNQTPTVNGGQGTGSGDLP